MSSKEMNEWWILENIEGVTGGCLPEDVCDVDKVIVGGWEKGPSGVAVGHRRRLVCGCADGCSAPASSDAVLYSLEYSQQVFLMFVASDFCSCYTLTFVPQLGNYLGALANWVKLQNNAEAGDELIFSVVGWHALTLPQNPRELAACRRDSVAALLAVGIDPNRSILFHQDQVNALANMYDIFLISDKGSCAYRISMDPWLHNASGKAASHDYVESRC